MATLLLSAAGTALGGAMGGSLAGIGTAVLGRAVGATLGSAIDQKLLGMGASPVETGRVERFRIMGSSEGAAIPRVFGRARVAGQVIWSSRFLESVNTEEVGGKGGGTAVREYSYSISLAVALCEGEISRVGRIWTDGQVLDQSGLTFRVHPGSGDQVPDPLIEAIEGVGKAPAYRGTAYVVFENLELAQFGNRIPQFNFEVFRRPEETVAGVPRPPALDIRGVALVPGTGEYALATEPIMFRRGLGESAFVNVHNDRGLPDFVASLDQLSAELPNCESVSLVATWFGDDLRCDRCALFPAVEQIAEDGDTMPWTVSGQTRADAKVVSRVDGRPIFGGTPADASVLQSIAHLKAAGKSVMFYPFILMDIQKGNGLGDPWTNGQEQPPVPWRGRITLSLAAGRAGSPDKTAVAAAEVANFFGTARAEDFSAAEDTASYLGPAEWSYRRFILHYAHLCKIAGGVDAFCIGSEMRGLTQIRDGATSYPAVQALKALAAEVRKVLGAGTKIGYAADWSEYFGHHPSDGSGDVLFHLDPLWASPDIDFVGIDNYMPLSDWRDGIDHADASAGSIYDLDYLRSNVAGGEGYDWYYANEEGRVEQTRLPITDGAYGQNWVFRYKDLESWWGQQHFNRPAGVRAAQPTSWLPKSKPIWFTELGCPAVDKGTNQPNVFYDPKSSESFFPYFSSGARDDLIQHRYLQAIFSHWTEPANNPRSDLYDGLMVDMRRAHVWAWDARPWPDFPARLDTWVDGTNHDLGHWLNGRTSSAALAEIVAQVCKRCGLEAIEVSRLHGLVTGYTLEEVESGRQSLQPLMLAYGFDSASDGRDLAFFSRGATAALRLAREMCVSVQAEPVLALTRAPAAETADRMTLSFVRADQDYLPGATEATAPGAIEPTTDRMTLPIVFRDEQADAIVGRSLREARVARDSLACALPPSRLSVMAGDVISIESDGVVDQFRVDRIEEAGHRQVTAVRVEAGVYRAPSFAGVPRGRAPVVQAPVPVDAILMDLPLLTGDEDPAAPHLAVARRPWAGSVAVFAASQDYGYRFDTEIRRPATFGETLEPFVAAEAGLWSPASLRVRLSVGRLEGRSAADVLSGANVAALQHGGKGDWEVFQFQTAELIAPKEYRLGMFLRGQAGTDGIVPDVWPAGARFVLLDGAPSQLQLPSGARGVERHYRVGPSGRPYDDRSYTHFTSVAAGIGLRPYRPVHGAARRLASGGVEVTWQRRSRIDGDSWGTLDVPIGEEAEAYRVVVRGSGLVLREETVSTARFVYGSVEQGADNAPASIYFDIAQISARFGPGPFTRVYLDG